VSGGGRMSGGGRGAGDRERRTEEPGGGWEADRRQKLTAGLALTPAERLAWLEEAIAFAHRAGALPRRPPSPDEGEDRPPAPGARRSAGPGHLREPS